MVQEDFALSVGLMADTDELESQIEDGDFTADVNLEGGGGGGGGGLLGGRGGRSSFLAGGAGLLAGGAVLGILAGILSQLEPINSAISLIARRFELFLVPILNSLSPVLNKLTDFVARAIRFLRDPFSSGTQTVFESAGRVTGRSEPANFLANQALRGVFRSIPGSEVFSTAGFLLESSDEAKKEIQGNWLTALLQGDYW